MSPLIRRGSSEVCTIARYGHVWNVHRMFIKIEHRNLEIRKTRNDFFVQVRNFLVPLSLKVFRHKEREAQSFYSGFFLCPPQHLWHLPQRSPQASGNQPSSPEAGLISTHWHFQNLPKSSALFRCMTSPALRNPASNVGYCDISEWHVRSASACANTCVNVAPK